MKGGRPRWFRIRGRFALGVVFVLLLGLVLLGFLGFPRIEAAAEAHRRISFFDGTRIASREAVSLRTHPEAFDIGLCVLHMDEPLSANLHESDLLQTYGMHWDDGAGLALSQWYTPTRIEFRSRSTVDHVTVEEAIAFLEGERPGLLELLMSSSGEVGRWGSLGGELVMWGFPSGELRVIEIPEGTALVSCAKDDYVGVPERACSLRGRWWARDGSVSFAFTYFWPDGEEPFEEDVCIEKARDLVSRFVISAGDEQGRREEAPPGPT